MNDRSLSDDVPVSEGALAELRRFDGKPPARSLTTVAAGHLVAMLIGNITPPMLIASSMGLSAADQSVLVQSAMLVAALSTAMQLVPVLGFGMGLPTVMGVSFAYVPVLTSIGLQYGVAGIFGAQLASGFLTILLGFFMGRIRRYFPPIVTGTVVLAIGVSLYSTAVNYMGGGSAAKAAGSFGSPEFLALAALTLAVTLACGFLGRGVVKVSGMLIGIAVGFVAALAMGVVDFSALSQAPWLSVPCPLRFGIEFHADAILLLALINVVQSVQMVGGVSSTTIGVFGREATAAEIGGSIKGQGLACVLGALFGGLPTSIFSQNVGLVCTSKMIARRAFLLTALVLLVDGLSPKLAAVATSVPLPVLGGATVTVFAVIAVSGIELICSQPLTYRNKVIVGLSLALGMGVGSVPEILQFLPQVAQNVLGSSLAVSFIVVFALNLIVPEGEEDRPVTRRG